MRKLIITSALIMFVAAIMIAVLMYMTISTVIITNHFDVPLNEDGTAPANGKITLLMMFVIAAIFSVSWIVCFLNYFISSISLFCRAARPTQKVSGILSTSVFITAVTFLFSITAAIFFTMIYLNFYPSLTVVAIVTYALFILNFLMLIITNAKLMSYLKRHEHHATVRVA